LWLTVLGAVLAFALPGLWDWAFGPPTAELTRLMNLEAASALATHQEQRGVMLAKLYAPGAEVIDAGCGSSRSSTTWHGTVQIAGRYTSLPQFDNLRHINTQFIWIPNNRWANRATATSETSGVISGSDTRKAQPIHGLERWEFEKINGRWAVTSFAYNVCLQ
jgi:hypothetical protein